MCHKIRCDYKQGPSITRFSLVTRTTHYAVVVHQPAKLGENLCMPESFWLDFIAWALFSSEKRKVFSTVALSFVCDKYYPIMD